MPFQNFESADGWIVVACPKQEIWERLCRAIEAPELLEEPEFASIVLRDRNRATLLPRLEAIFKRHTTEEWVTWLEAAGVPVGRINGLAEALVDKQVVARDGVDTYQHDVLGEVHRVRSPLRMSGPRRPAQRGPHLGEHTDAVLADIGGYGPDEIRDLAARGAFGACRSGRRVTDQRRPPRQAGLAARGPRCLTRRDRGEDVRLDDEHGRDREDDERRQLGASPGACTTVSRMTMNGALNRTMRKPAMTPPMRTSMRIPGRSRLIASATQTEAKIGRERRARRGSRS